jgi:hypothetical protein
VIILGVGYAFAPIDAALPFSLARTVAWLAVFGVGVTTFQWAEIRGFPARNREGHVQVAHIARSLVMTWIMTVVVVIASSPIFVLVHALSAR